MLDQISHQIASIGGQISSNFSTPSLPYPPFHPLASDRRVTIFWLLSLICSLIAALLATLVQQWSKVYLHIFQQASNPLQIARFRAFLFEGSERLPVLAEVVLALIHISLSFFLLGLCDFIMQIDKTIFSIILVPITLCASFYLYCIIAPMRNPQSPYRTPFSGFIWFLIQKLLRSPCFSRFRGQWVKPTSIGKHQEQCSMEKAERRMNRDVRAIQWLVDRINGSDEMQALVLAIPGSFNGEWGQGVWKGVVIDQSTSPADLQARSHPGPPLTREGTELCRRVRYFFETYRDEGNFIHTGIGRTRRMRGYVETAASLVCCTGVELGLFGEVGELLSEMGEKEKTYDPSKIRSTPSFAVRLTCLSLVAIRKMVGDNRLRLQELAKLSLDDIPRLQKGYGYHQDTMSLMAIAQRVDDYLTMSWAHVVELHLAVQSWNMNRAESDIKRLLNSHGESISELERIAYVAGGVEEVDWHFSLLLDTIDETTHKLMQRLPGVFFDKPKPDKPSTIGEVFGFPSVGNTPVPPQLIPPGRQIQSLCTLGRKLRDIIEGRNPESQEETLKNLGSVCKIPVSLSGLNYLMKRQLWRLLDLRDGSGLGFTIELFFLALRQLELPSTSSPSELKKIFYTGTFEAITSDWKNSKDSVGTQRVLLDLICDLVIESRGAFSDFRYPPYIVELLLELVGKMIEGHEGFRQHIDDIIQELEEVNFRNLTDNDLRDKALKVIDPPIPRFRT